MKFEQTIVVDAPVAEVEALLADVPRVARCVPGVEDVTSTEPDVYDGRIRVKVGPLGFTLGGRARLERTADGTWRLQGDGRDGRIGAGVSAALEAQLAALTSEQTEVRVVADVQFSGRLAELGQPLIRRKADAMVQQFAENLRREFA